MIAERKDRKKIAILDTDQNARLLLQTLFQDEGYVVYQTDSISAVRKMITQKNIDLIIIEPMGLPKNEVAALVSGRYGVPKIIYSVQIIDPDDQTYWAADCLIKQSNPEHMLRTVYKIFHPQSLCVA